MSAGNATRGWPFSPALLSNLRGLRRAQRQGGCAVGCEVDRTADDDLPWPTGDGFGGWGGHAHHGTEPGVENTPVIFVHGNQRDACDFTEHAEYFLERGYRGDELWAITFDEGSPTHPSMAAQLDVFVSNVRQETGADQVSIVAHSLGVTGVRFWLAAADRYDWVDAFVGLAGANHGMIFSSWCADSGMTDGPYKVSPFLRADYDDYDDHPLSLLNENETPGDIRYYTIRGSEDPLFWNCPDSPALEGAVNLELETDHDGVRVDREAKARMFEWLSGTHPYDLTQFAAD
ncbi:esterase/lipase family protein [Natronomonas sp. EA1]|uniref:esterase/lipase family protein n=1 Tax=Natronomonas sp. EA1 TaxID=3421655 RepID=UPI003EBF0657